MGCTLSKLHDVTIALNIRNIYPYANSITVSTRIDSRDSKTSSRSWIS
jgi:hypothetical protein